MATKAIVEFGLSKNKLFHEPVLEIGSLIDPSYEQQLPKSIHTADVKDYTGIDIFEGEGVDRVINLCKENEIPQEWLANNGYFSTVHCHCVLEHVTDIFSISRNISRIIKPGGVLFVSVPFVWKIHRIPVDMWRMTPQSIDYLFPDFHFQPENCGWSTRKSEYYPIDNVPELNVGNKLSDHHPVFQFLIKCSRKLKLDSGFFSFRALYPEINLMMIGTKKDKPTYTFISEKLL